MHPVHLQRRGYAHGVPELPEIEAWVRELAPLVSRAPDRARRAGARRDAEDVRPAARALDGRRLAGAGRRGKNLLFPTDDGELVLRVHLMSAGRLRYLAPGSEGAEDAGVPARVRGRRPARAHRGRLEEAGGRLAADAGGARGGARPPRARRARAGRGAARARSSRATAAGCTRCSATSARSPGSAAHTRTRSSGARGCRRFALSTDLDDDAGRAARGRDRRGPGARARAAGARARATRDVYQVHDKLGEPCPRLRRRRSAGSTTRSTRSTTAPTARPAGACSRTGACRGCCARGRVPRVRRAVLQPTARLPARRAAHPHRDRARHRAVHRAHRRPQPAALRRGRGRALALRRHHRPGRRHDRAPQRGRRRGPPGPGQRLPARRLELPRAGPTGRRDHGRGRGARGARGQADHDAADDDHQPGRHRRPRRARRSSGPSRSDDPAPARARPARGRARALDDDVVLGLGRRPAAPRGVVARRHGAAPG